MMGDGEYKSHCTIATAAAAAVVPHESIKSLILIEADSPTTSWAVPNLAVHIACGVFTEVFLDICGRRRRSEVFACARLSPVSDGAGLRGTVLCYVHQPKGPRRVS